MSEGSRIGGRTRREWAEEDSLDNVNSVAWAELIAAAFRVRSEGGGEKGETLAQLLKRQAAASHEGGYRAGLRHAAEIVRAGGSITIANGLKARSEEGGQIAPAPSGEKGWRQGAEAMRSYIATCVSSWQGSPSLGDAIRALKVEDLK